MSLADIIGPLRTIPEHDTCSGNPLVPRSVNNLTVPVVSHKLESHGHGLGSRPVAQRIS